MSYCSIQSVQRIIGQSLSSATNQPTGGQQIPLTDFGNQIDQNHISTEIIYHYIGIASQEIDSALSEMYETPLCEKTDLQLSLLFDVNEYNTDVYLNKADVLLPEDNLIFTDGADKDRAEVVSININEKMVVLNSGLIANFDKNVTRVLRVTYPAPIPSICSRLAAANIYDKFFSAQQEPNVSEFGRFQRKQGYRDIDSILHGRTILEGQRRIGHRFKNPNIIDRYRLPGISDQDGSRSIPNIE